MKPVQARCSESLISGRTGTIQRANPAACSETDGEAYWPKPACGFSLLELLLVVAILVLLFTLYWSPKSGTKQRALAAACQRNLEKIQISMQIFATDHAGGFPAGKGAKTSAEALEPLVPKYASDISLFICPASKDSVAPGSASLKAQKISYAYYVGRAATNSGQVLLSDAQVDTKAKSAGQLVFSADGKPPGNNHENTGGNLLFCDGHVEFSPPKAKIDLPVGPGEELLNPESAH
jgi:prepilin-type N-terminal cleavage/methylation domain-containing protein/prepilin-type processing-associated H-X9-DG protein